MNRFLSKQLTSAESKPLGRTERRYDFNPETGRGEDRQYRCDAAEKPPNTFSFATPVGRSRGVVKPGEEATGERYEAPSYGTFSGAIALPSYRKTKR